MNSIPIALLFFTSTKGHFGFKRIYRDTLEHLNKNILIKDFQCRVAHVKVSDSPEDEILAKQMEQELREYGFDEVILVKSDWSRGIVHQNEYMRDVIRVSKVNKIYDCPHVLWLEDDSPFVCHKESLLSCLHRMTKIVDSSPDIISARFLRRGDFCTSPTLIEEGEDRYFWSPHFNFQPLIMRSRDFYLASKVIEDNFDKVSNIQCEMLWRLVLNPFSRSEKKHLVWYPDYGETFHIGIQDYENAKKVL